MKLTVSLVQMDIVVGQIERNFAKARALVEEAARRGSHLVLLPELWATGYDLPNADRDATATSEGAFAEMANLAKTHGVYLMGSSLGRNDEGRPTNYAMLFDAEGEAIGEYTKVHLFRPIDEHVHLAAGDRLAMPNTPWGRMAMTLCYDLRFPEMFRVLALAGCKIVLLSAEWPWPRLGHWQTLLRARAIENQVFVLACNRVGTSSELSYFGHSSIVDPWGEVLVEAGEREMIVTAEIDLEQVGEVRSRMAVYSDRRPDVYSSVQIPR